MCESVNEILKEREFINTTFNNVLLHNIMKRKKKVPETNSFESLDTVALFDLK